MGRALAALLLLLALTGCVQTTRPPAAGFTDAQNEAYAQQYVDTMWASSPFADQRPADLEVTLVSADEWGTAFVACLAEAGYTGYTAVGGGGYSFDHTPQEAEQFAQFVCASTHQVGPEQSGQLNERQLGFLYDYYRESVVPCYELAGIEVGKAPSRDEFVESGGDWIPSPVADNNGLSNFEQGESPWYRSTPDNDLFARCPLTPPGWEEEYFVDG